MGDGEPVACRPPVTHRQGRAPAALWALAPSAAPSSWVSSVVGATRRAGAALAPVTPVCRPASLQVVGERMGFVRQAEQGGRGRLPVAGLSVIKIRLATPVAATPERRPRVRPSPHPPPPHVGCSCCPTSVAGSPSKSPSDSGREAGRGAAWTSSGSRPSCRDSVCPLLLVSGVGPGEAARGGPRVCPPRCCTQIWNATVCR